MAQFKYKLKEIKVGDIDVQGGTKYTVTSIDPDSGAVEWSVEKVADFIHPEYHERIGFIKDIAAGAVFFAALTAIVIGAIIYVPKF
jgi:hypothetical protein